MHGIVHQRFKEYVVDGAEEAGWQAVLDHAGLEQGLYLAVSSYPDEDLDAALDALSTLSGHDRPAIERDFGRFLAPSLRSTFRSHLPEGDLPILLEELASIAASLDGVEATTDPPSIAGERTDGAYRVTYRSERGYCAMAYGVLEGLIDEHGASASVRKVACVDDGNDDCAFLVTFEE